MTSTSWGGAGGTAWKLVWGADWRPWLTAYTCNDHDINDQRITIKMNIFRCSFLWSEVHKRFYRKLRKTILIHCSWEREFLYGSYFSHFKGVTTMIKWNVTITIWGLDLDSVARAGEEVLNADSPVGGLLPVHRPGVVPGVDHHIPDHVTSSNNVLWLVIMTGSDWQCITCPVCSSRQFARKYLGLGALVSTSQ